MKRIVAIIAALALLCSSALAGSIFNPEDMIGSYNASLHPVLMEMLDDEIIVAVFAERLKLSYYADSRPGYISYWTKNMDFCISFDAPDRYTTGVHTHFYCTLTENSEIGTLPLLHAALAVGNLDRSLDVAAFYNWIAAMQDGSRFKASTWHANMIIAEDGSYMSFSIFPD